MRTLATFTALALTLAGCSSGETSSTEATPAVKLVTVWKEKYVEASDPVVVTVQQHLSTLARKCHTSEEAQANRVMGTWKIVKQGFPNETPITLMEVFERSDVPCK
jgi:hypothetical protein